MLENLDVVDWASLTHAYGTAEDVPDLIRDLCSPDKDVRKQAVYELYGNIFHQGDRYEATAYAVPFLFEVLADPDTPDRAQIVHLLACLAVGYANGHMATGFPIAVMRQSLAQTAPEMLDDWLGQMKEWLASFGEDGRPGLPRPLSAEQRKLLEVRHEVSAYDAVAQGVPILVNLLDETDTGLVGQAIYTLAWFPNHADVIVPQLTRVATDKQQPVDIVSSAIVALGMVAPSDHIDDGLTRTHLDGVNPDLRWSAAVAYAHLAGTTMPEVAIAELAAWARRYNEDTTSTMWEVTRPELALELLDRHAVDLARQIRTELVAAELATPPTSNWHNHFNVVLHLAFPTMDDSHMLTFDQLTPAQQSVVVWLINNPHAFGSSGPQYPLKQHGLPTTLDGLRSYANGKPVVDHQPPTLFGR